MKYVRLFVLLFVVVANAAAQDRVMLQGFYWDVYPGGVWYDSLITRAAHLDQAGFDAVWLPPPTKGAASGFDVGYTPYDYYDLGQYDSCGGNTTQGQGGCIPTRYGTYRGLEEAVDVLKSHGLDVYADVVLNHRSGGSLEPNVYGSYYTGGGSLYSEDGDTYTAFPLTHGSGRLAWPVGDGNEMFFPNASNNPGNTFDFYSDAQLAGFHQMYVNSFAYDNALHNGFGDNLPLGDSLIAWGNWLTTKLGLDGYRFDFVKGIHPEYLKRWVNSGAMQGKFHVHELFDGSISRLTTYHGQVSGTVQPPAVFDFNMRFAYKDVLDGGAPIWRWHDSGLMNHFGFPFEQIVTFVDNHDFDRLNYQGQVTIDGHSPVINNKMLAYAHMLTHPGQAMVWWRDYYQYGLRPPIDALIRYRKAYASGSFWTLTRGSTGSPFWPDTNPANPWDYLYVAQRNGTGGQTGLIVAINKHPSQWAEVWVTQQNGAWTNKTLKDATGNGGGGTSQIFGDNRVRVWAPPLSYTIWVPTDYAVPDPPPNAAPDEPTYFDVDWANLQAPGSAEISEGEQAAFSARAYIHGITDEAGTDGDVSVWIGYDVANTDPSTWTNWVPASYAADVGHLDEYTASLSGLEAGTYFVASRIQYDGKEFYYGGYSDPHGGLWDGETHDSAILTVNFVPPPAVGDVAAAPSPASVGQPVLLTATASGTATITSAEYSLDDGSSWLPMEAADGTFDDIDEVLSATLSEFAEAGVRNVCVRAGNSAGKVSDPECILLAVFDPSAGFVTGGGWIESPPGAYAPDPAAGGKAHVKIEARYKKNGGTLDGRVTFRLKGFEFESTAIEWLAVSTDGAKIGGTGAVGDVDGYGFILTAVDDEPDAVRIQIWLDDVVYDNQPGSPVTGYDATRLGGGQITIHHDAGVSKSGDIVPEPEVPAAFALHQNFPNPFNPSTVIAFDLPSAEHVRLAVYDATGREVAHLIDEAVAAGKHQISWDARALPSGVYVVRITAATFTATRRLVLSK